MAIKIIAPSSTLQNAAKRIENVQLQMTSEDGSLAYLALRLQQVLPHSDHPPGAAAAHNLLVECTVAGQCTSSPGRTAGCQHATVTHNSRRTGLQLCALRFAVSASFPTTTSLLARLLHISCPMHVSRLQLYGRCSHCVGAPCCTCGINSLRWWRTGAARLALHLQRDLPDRSASPCSIASRTLLQCTAVRLSTVHLYARQYVNMPLPQATADSPDCSCAPCTPPSAHPSQPQRASLRNCFSFFSC